MTRFRYKYLFIPLVLITVIIGAVITVSGRHMPDVTKATNVEQAPQIDPDYTSLVIPPNVAPLNFRIAEEGHDFVVTISGERGTDFQVHCPDGNCRIPIDAWRKLLKENRDRTVHFDVYAKAADGQWTRFERISNRVASEPIDSYVVYRRLVPNKARSVIRGIFQRCVETFEVSPLLTTRDGTIHCFNCHTFHQNDPNKFLFHVRGEYIGMVLVDNGKVRRINTMQEPMFRPLAYASWHPNGRHIAATCNRFIGHTPAQARTYYFEALDRRGDLVVYDVEENKISTSADIFGGEYIETHPCWSHDGEYLYYCRAKELPIVEPDDWDDNDFDLMRVPYDVATNEFGTPELVNPFSERGISCAFPRPSPCGKYVLHMLADKTTYPIHQESSDVYLLDLESRESKKLDSVCSDLAESFPRWSSNGRWFSFLSSRRDGMSALPYIAYFDEQGQAHKAFVLPQRDPTYYNTFTDTYNTLELVRSRVNISPFKLAEGIFGEAIDAEFPDPPSVDAYTGPTKRVGQGY